MTDDILLTARLRFRPLDRSDAMLYRALYTCPVVMADIGRPLTRDAADAAFLRICTERTGDQPSNRYWAIEHRGTARPVGITALIGRGVVLEFGLMLIPSEWNGDNSRDAIDAVLSHAFFSRGRHSVLIDCQEGRTARVARRLLRRWRPELIQGPSGRVQWLVPNPLVAPLSTQVGISGNPE